MKNETIIANRDLIPYVELARPTKDIIAQCLRQNQAFVELCLLIMYCLQTPEERAGGQTIAVNGIGWNKQDGKHGWYFAEYVAYQLNLRGQAGFGSFLRGNNRTLGKSNLDCARHTLISDKKSYCGQLEHVFSNMVPQAGGFNAFWAKYINPQLGRAAHNGYLTAKKYNPSLPAPHHKDCLCDACVNHWPGDDCSGYLT